MIVYYKKLVLGGGLVVCEEFITLGKLIAL